MKQDTVHMTPDTSLENDDTELFIQIASCLFSAVYKSVCAHLSECRAICDFCLLQKGHIVRSKVVVQCLYITSSYRVTTHLLDLDRQITEGLHCLETFLFFPH